MECVLLDMLVLMFAPCFFNTALSTSSDSNISHILSRQTLGSSLSFILSLRV